MYKVQEIPKESININEYYRKHFFYPASIAYYKNHRCIDIALKYITAAEKAGIQIDFTVPPKEQNKFQSKEIRCIGNIAHSEVMDRYASEILIFPSYVETYGLPLAEARLSGGLVFAADTPFAHEILDGYENAYFFDPFQPKQLAVLIKRVCAGAIKKRDIAETQSLNSVQSSWEKVVECIQNAVVG